MPSSPTRNASNCAAAKKQRSQHVLGADRQDFAEDLVEAWEQAGEPANPCSFTLPGTKYLHNYGLHKALKRMSGLKFVLDKDSITFMMSDKGPGIEQIGEFVWEPKYDGFRNWDWANGYPDGVTTDVPDPFVEEQRLLRELEELGGISWSASLNKCPRNEERNPDLTLNKRPQHNPRPEPEPENIKQRTPRPPTWSEEADLARQVLEMLNSSNQH